MKAFLGESLSDVLAIVLLRVNGATCQSLPDPLKGVLRRRPDSREVAAACKRLIPVLAGMRENHVFGPSYECIILRDFLISSQESLGVGGALPGAFFG
jgi:hypothetical protein